MNITSKQWFQIVSGIVSSLITAGALFTSLFGEAITLKIIACLGLANIMLNSIGAALSGQANLIKDVAAMPGVDSIKVNSDANSTLAALAMDPLQDKVAAKPSDADDVLATAKAGV